MSSILLPEVKVSFIVRLASSAVRLAITESFDVSNFSGSRVETDGLDTEVPMTNDALETGSGERGCWS